MPVPSWMSGAAVIFYLHGFASSHKSTKAHYFAEQLSRHRMTLRCPDFNEPDFSTLTLTRMLDQVVREIDAAGSEPATLIGSSLGGALAVLAAGRWPSRIGRLILLAPAVEFAKPGHHLLPPERVEEWRARGVLPFFHYGYSEERSLRFGFYEDSLTYDPFETEFDQPTIIFQGRRDTSVDPRTVEQFAGKRPNVTLSLLDDDHQLMASLPRIWSDMEAFLGLDE